MKSESDTNAADEDENKWSFLRRLIVAMAAERLKKSDEVVKPRPPARRDDSTKPPFAHAASVAARVSRLACWRCRGRAKASSGEAEGAGGASGHRHGHRSRSLLGSFEINALGVIGCAMPCSAFSSSNSNCRIIAADMLRRLHRPDLSLRSKNQWRVTSA